MRQFILENQKIKNGLITLQAKDFRYLRQVLRAKVGDMISVRLPNGTLQNSTVCKIDDNAKSIVLQICADTSAQTSNESITRGVQATEVSASVSPVEYWLFQFLPKPQKFEQIVRQATECGVSKIIPVIGEYTEKSSVTSLQGAKSERLQRIIKEARQQSGSPVDTKVTEPLTLENALQQWDLSGIGFVLSERDDGNTLKQTLEAAANSNSNEQNGVSAFPKRVCIAVGSEGGISPEEVATLLEKGLFHPVHFAVNILRCETAALYGIAAVQSFVNEILGTR